MRVYIRYGVVFSAILWCLALLGACDEEDIGTPCHVLPNQTDADQPLTSNGTAFLFSSTECRYRICVDHVTNQNSFGLCTRICEADSDCPDSTEFCPDGYVCHFEWPFSNQPMGCCKFCICKTNSNITGAIDPYITVDTYCTSHPNPNCSKYKL